MKVQIYLFAYPENAFYDDVNSRTIEQHALILRFITV